MEKKITEMLNKPAKVDDTVIDDIINSLKYMKEFVDINHYVAYSIFVSRDVKAIIKEQFEKIVKEIPEVKDFFVEENGYYRLKDLTKE
ncbi:hypothetical protein BA065_03355 [Nanoarchaeota archaeon NZ13-N]|nr:MAG: hypothetical protein BA065_03355 [Nanoarchaeota archaeon NZ13-N]